MTLRQTLWLGFGGLLLVLLVASGMGVVVFSHYNRAFDHIFHENYDSVYYCEQMKQALDGLNEEAQKILWDLANAPQARVALWERQFSENIEKQRHNCFLFHEQEKSDALRDGWDQFREEYRQFSHSDENERRAMFRQVILPHIARLRTAAEDILGMNLRNMVDTDGQVRGIMDQVRSALLALAAAGAILAVLFVLVIGPRMLRPLSQLTRSARQIADGQLDLFVKIKTRDEVGQLGHAFNVMAQRLREARERDRDRLARTEQTTQMAIDSLPDAVVVFGANGEIELTNRAATDMFGLQPHAPSPHAWLTAMYEQVIHSGQPCEPRGYSSAIQKFANGEERFLLPHAVPLRVQDGRTVGVTVICADVTHLKHVDEAKSDLVSTVSHELRTPLTSIRMAVHMLADETFGEPLAPQQRELLRAARDNSDRLHRTLENLLSISRMESGRAPLQMRPVHASEIISSAAAPLHVSFGEAGVRLNVESLPADVLVRADMSCITHVLTNLLGNALRFSPRGGEVRITGRAQADVALFAVSDDGPGIAPEHLPHLFEKFYRVAIPSHPAGAGLGLAIAKEIVAAHGGTISAESTFGHGATFAFTLQLAAPLAEAAG